MATLNVVLAVFLVATLAVVLLPSEHFLPHLSFFRREAFRGSGMRSKYVEAWHFRLTLGCSQRAMFVMPGLFLGNETEDAESHAFIVVTVDNATHYYRFPAEEFRASADALDVDIAGNRFTRDRMVLALHPMPDQPHARASIMGTVHFTDMVPWPVSATSPGMMGPVAYLPWLPHQQDVISISHHLQGVIHIDDEELDFVGGRGYTEKHFGSRYPDSWVWAHCNSFEPPGAAGASPTTALVSIGSMAPLDTLVSGFVVALHHGASLLRFVPYRGASPVRFDLDRVPGGRTAFNLSVQDGHWALELNVTTLPDDHSAAKMFAPRWGQMLPYADQHQRARMDVRLLRDGCVEFHATCQRSGLVVAGDLHPLMLKLANSYNIPLHLKDGEGDRPTAIRPARPGAGVVRGILSLLGRLAASLAPLGYLPSSNTIAVLLAFFAVLVGGGMFLLLGTPRRYASAASVSEQYDKWTEDGVMEKFWGEHVHQGYYPNGTYAGVDFKLAKVELVDRLLAWAGLHSATHVLDAGCGFGGSARHIARYMGARVTGVTLSARQCERALQLTEQAGLAHLVDIVHGDAGRLPYASETFDVVWSCECAEHVEDKAGFVRELCRVLRPGGLLVMTTITQRASSAQQQVEDRSLQRIRDEFAYAPLVTTEELVSMVDCLDNMVEIDVEDWSDVTSLTWQHGLRLAMHKPWSVLSRGPRATWRMLRDCATALSVLREYKRGVLQYTVLRARKANGGAAAPRPCGL